MSMASEFKTFVQRGNVIDMAIGIIMGGAFGKIVSSFVGDVLMPPIGLALGGIDFKSLKVTLGGTAEAPVTVNYGLFAKSVVDFLIVAFCVFLVVKAVNAMKKPEPPAAPAEPPAQEKLLAEIRDLLRPRG
jgi:large conductance mechanosensitive channel